MKLVQPLRMAVFALLGASVLAGSAGTGPALAQATASEGWHDPSLSPDRRAALLVARMTPAEKLLLLHGYYPNKMPTLPPGVAKSAGWFPGVPRLGIPALRETDASLGVAAAHQVDNAATALPSGLAMAATWNPRRAYDGGALIGKEARQKGFNVMLAGGVNLVREPRNGRNFEYLGEDPLLAGIMAGNAIKGIESNAIVATIKHYALNAQETGRMVLSANLGEAALRESDLLAFQKGIEIGDPGSVMCAYNRINGVYACENAMLLKVLKKDWGYQGWVMSDWGAVHSTVAAIDAGLDQESGQELDDQVFFGKPLEAALASGTVKQAQVDAMVGRIVRTLFAKGVMDHPVTAGGLDVAAGVLDVAAGGGVARATAVEAIVLLKNDAGLLPLAAGKQTIAVIGSHADVGVLSGGGSSQVVPVGSLRVDPRPGAPSWSTGTYYHPSSPLAAIRAQAPLADVRYDAGTDLAAAAALAHRADVVVVFAHQWTSEGMDTAMTLDAGQDALVEAVTRANPRTVVVLENGGPVAMPWLGQAGAVVEAWYPGSAGGPAIADILFGAANPAGRLPVTFPADLGQLPNPALPGADLPRPTAHGDSQPKPFDVTYPEGADVGYRWYQRQGHQPLFNFGYGLSYTRFSHAGLHFDPRTMTATFSVTNTGPVRGIDTPQLYMDTAGGVKRLVGWGRVALEPGATRQLTIGVDPRFISRFDTAASAWKLAAGSYTVTLANDAADKGQQVTAVVPARTTAVGWRPDVVDSVAQH